MNLVYWFLFLNLLVAQEINPVPEIIISSKDYSKTAIYQNQLYTINNVFTPTVYQYDLTTDLQDNSGTLTSTMMTLILYNQNLYIGNSGGGIYVLPINNLNGGYASYTSGGDVYSLAVDPINNFLFVGTFNGIEKWNLNTMTAYQSESIALGYVYSIVVDQQVVYMSGDFYTQTNQNQIQVRNSTNLNHLVTTLIGHTDFVLALAQGNGYLYSGSKDTMIKKWRLTNFQLVSTFVNHTYDIVTLKVYENYLFSGSDSYEWIQWELPLGKVIRKMNTQAILTLNVYVPYLIVAGINGLMKFRIPELVQYMPILSTTLNTISENTTSLVTKTTQTVAETTKINLQASTAKEFTETIKNSLVIQTFAVQTIATQTFDNFLFTATLASRKNSEAPVSFSLQNQSFSFLLYYIIGVAFVCVLIGCLCSFAIYRYLSKKRASNATKSTNDSFSTTERYSTKTTTTTTTDTSNSYLTQTNVSISSEYFSTVSPTLIGTQNAYSIPGFLQLPSGSIQVVKEIGRGGQGTISIAEIIDSVMYGKLKVKEVVVKSTTVDFEDLTERQKNVFNQELSIIYYFREKPGFVRIYGYTLQPAAIILKFYPMGNMENLVLRKKQFKTLKISKWFMIRFLLKFTHSIMELHNAGFVHCDIKPQNILLETDQQNNICPILTDFGITQIVSEQILTVKAMTLESLKGFSVSYGAPEQIKQMRDKMLKPMRPEVVKRRDIYAIAGLLYGLVSGKEPWFK